MNNLAKWKIEKSGTYIYLKQLDHLNLLCVYHFLIYIGTLYVQSLFTENRCT